LYSARISSPSSLKRSNLLKINPAGISYASAVTRKRSINPNEVRGEARVTIRKEVLKDKVTLLSGHSGVGKSTLVNTIMPALELRTTKISEWHDKGMHTTTFAVMYELHSGGFLIDTPGIRELGIIDIEPQELGDFFPEIRDRRQHCRFHNCRHINEPGCAVLKALENDEIEPSRYESYLSIYHGQDTRA